MIHDYEGTGVLGLMINARRGGVINSADLAIRMAELILEGMEGPDSVARSRPFSVEDTGEIWHVWGCPESAHEEEDGRVAPWSVRISKFNAAVTWLGRLKRMKISKEMLRPVEGWQNLLEGDKDDEP